MLLGVDLGYWVWAWVCRFGTRGYSTQHSGDESYLLLLKGGECGRESKREKEGEREREREKRAMRERGEREREGEGEGERSKEISNETLRDKKERTLRNKNHLLYEESKAKQSK